ncbi:hypothetical protein CFAM422_010849 [Trichoderma lentiforme]|uniref:Uncharacterized protein n=1 Tax=Trichoderma lentiforme TaxID=1567552 RepID=A0A9P4X7E3_9HYPO|nr:hypothetical protein CFAM422_010849 [Trichoderma lentiforme]
MRRPRPHWLLGLNAWGILKCRGAISTAIALGIDLAVDKYESLGDDGATHAGIVSDRLIHRVSDVTAIAFTAIVVVKLLVSTWIAHAIWACIYRLYLTQTSFVTKSENV